MCKGVYPHKLNNALQRARGGWLMSQPMYRFLELTIEQYMTRILHAVGRDTSLRELERPFCSHDFQCVPGRLELCCHDRVMNKVVQWDVIERG
jgi:hypothetical protein